MSQWISIEAAAEKYRLEKEYIWLWVEMKKITVSYENDTVSIDDDSIQQFIKRTKLGITSEYIDELEQLCMEKNKTSRLYASLLNMRDQELMAIRGQSSRLDGLWKMVEEQYERLRSFEKNSMSDNAICSNCCEFNLLNNRLTIKVRSFYCQPIVMAYCQGAMSC